MPVSTQDLKDIIVNDAARLGNDPALMLALADHESAGFNPTALSPTGVRGLFQVTNKTGADYGQTPQTRRDPRVSSAAGQQYFKDLLFKAGGDVPTALRWYNGGSDAQFATRVLAKVAGHQATLTAEPSTADILRDVYGDRQATAATPATAEAEPSAADILHDVYGPTTPAAASPPPAAAPPWYVRLGNALDRGPDPSYETDASRARDARVLQTGRPDPDLPLEESLNPVDLALTGGGAALGARLGTTLAARFAGKAAPLVRPLVTGLGTEAGYKLSQGTGNAPGHVRDVGLPDLLNVTLPGTLDALAAGGRTLGGATRAGRALRAAETETAARQAAYETEVAAHASATQDALGLAQRTHADRLAEAEALQADKVTADLTAHQHAKAEAAATYTRQMDDYGNASTAHQTAATKAGQVTTAAPPLTPSWVLYQKVRDAAPEALVDFAPVAQTAKDLASAQGAEYLPPRVAERLARLHTGDPTGTVASAHEELKFWGPLTNSKNGSIRGTAKQVYGALQDTLEQGASEMPATAGAVDLLRDARGAFRKEKAVEDIQRVVRASGKTGDDGVFRYRPGNVVTQLDKLIATDPLFKGSFAPGELDALRADFMDLTGIPKVATTRPVLTDVGPAPVTPVPRRLESLRATQPSDLPLPGVPERPALPVPVEAKLPPSLKNLATHYFAELTGGGTLSYLGGGAKWPLYLGATAAAIDTGDALLSKALMTPNGRAWLKQQMDHEGSVSLPALLSGVTGARAATGP